MISLTYIVGRRDTAGSVNRWTNRPVCFTNCTRVASTNVDSTVRLTMFASLTLQVASQPAANSRDHGFAIIATAINRWTKLATLAAVLRLAIRWTKLTSFALRPASTRASYLSSLLSTQPPGARGLFDSDRQDLSIAPLHNF